MQFNEAPHCGSKSIRLDGTEAFHVLLGEDVVCLTLNGHSQPNTVRIYLPRQQWPALQQAIQGAT